MIRSMQKRSLSAPFAFTLFSFLKNDSGLFNFRNDSNLDFLPAFFLPLLHRRVSAHDHYI